MRRCWSQDISKSHSTTSLTLKKVHLVLLLNVQFICLFQCYTSEMDVWSSDENDTETVLWYGMTDVFSLYHCHWQFVISFCKQKCKEMSGCSWHHHLTILAQLALTRDDWHHGAVADLTLTSYFHHHHWVTSAPTWADLILVRGDGGVMC